jgi:phospholipase/carboxylesterase
MRETVGQLECLVRPGENDKRSVVLLHGFGADNSDLYPLADVLDPDGEWTFYFPNAPHEVPIGPAWSGRGWFPISVRDLENRTDFSQTRPPGLSESAALISDLMFHLQSERLVLGGFSQGAMVSTEVALSEPSDVSAVILYSPTLLDEKNWTAKAPGLNGKRVLLSHGTRDEVLPFAGAQRLHEILKSAGAEIRMVSFTGAHEIPNVALQQTRQLLSTLNE